MDILIVIGIMIGIILAIILLYCFKCFLDEHEKAYDIFCYIIGSIVIVMMFVVALGLLFIVSHEIAVGLNLIERILK